MYLKNKGTSTKSMFLVGMEVHLISVPFNLRVHRYVSLPERCVCSECMESEPEEWDVMGGSGGMQFMCIALN